MCKNFSTHFPYILVYPFLGAAESIMDDTSRVVDGFVFPSFKEAQIAIKEQQNIEVIKQRLPQSDPNAMHDLYVKLIERNMFKTVIGYSFLHELRHRLMDEYHYAEDELPDVEIPKRMEYDTVSELNQSVLKNKFERLQLVKNRMTIVIIALVFMVVGMFVIAVINPNAGYINTENKVLNKYSAWEEDLQQREKAVKEKEEQLKNQGE